MKLNKNIVFYGLLLMFFISCNNKSSIGKYIYCSRTNVLHCDKNCKEIFETKDYEGNGILGVKFLDTLNIVEDNTFRYAYCNVCFNDELYEHVRLIIKRNNEINRFREYVFDKLRMKIDTYYLNIYEFDDFCNYIEDRTNRERIYKISIEYNIFRGGYDDFEKKIMFK